MTPREYARLQGVPDSYPIVADGVQALTGFGDAVSVPVINWIAQNVLTPLIGDNLDNAELRNHLAAYSVHDDGARLFWRVYKNKQTGFLEHVEDDRTDSNEQPA